MNLLHCSYMQLYICYTSIVHFIFKIYHFFISYRNKINSFILYRDTYVNNINSNFSFLPSFSNFAFILFLVSFISLKHLMFYSLIIGTNWNLLINLIDQTFSLYFLFLYYSIQLYALVLFYKYMIFYVNIYYNYIILSIT